MKDRTQLLFGSERPRNLPKTTPLVSRRVKSPGPAGSKFNAFSLSLPGLLVLGLYVTPGSDSYQEPGTTESPLHIPSLCLPPGWALTSSLLLPSSFLQAHRTSPFPGFLAHPSQQLTLTSFMHSETYSWKVARPTPRQSTQAEDTFSRQDPSKALPSSLVLSS